MDDARDARAEDLSDTDLFCALDGVVGSQPKKTQTGDEDRQYGEIKEEAAKSVLGAVLLVKPFVEKIIFIGAVGNGLYPLIPYALYRRRQIPGRHFYRP